MVAFLNQFKTPVSVLSNELNSESEAGHTGPNNQDICVKFHSGALIALNAGDTLESLTGSSGQTLYFG
jgi:hypothetical protein